MDTLLRVVTNLQTRRFEEDFLDRVNYQFTAYLFSFGSIIITSKLYMGTPIICWVEYTRDYCLIENTYYIPMNDPNMPSLAYREKAELPYYQWVQFVLVLLAFCFYLPHVYWRSVNWWSGIQLRAIVKACYELPKEDIVGGDESPNKEIRGGFPRSSWVEYTRDYCLIENTYYIPMNDPNMPSLAYREKAELPYYQFLLAFCFYPTACLLEIRIQLRAIVKACYELPKEDIVKRQEGIEKIANHIYRATHRNYKNVGSIWQHLMGDGWMSFNYIVMKLMFVLNAALQILILHYFLGFDWGDLL
ncbi:innexin-3 domain protein, partial [Ostertagia ostertagi]